jgi:hypothetical protein
VCVDGGGAAKEKLQRKEKKMDLVEVAFTIQVH